MKKLVGLGLLQKIETALNIGRSALGNILPADYRYNDQRLIARDACKNAISALEGDTLFRAAPELLAACEAVKARFEPGGWRGWRGAEAEMAQLEAAIAKARGR